MDNLYDINRSVEPAHVPNTRYAGFWRRFLAFIIDDLIVAFIAGICVAEIISKVAVVQLYKLFL